MPAAAPTTATLPAVAPKSPSSSRTRSLLLGYATAVTAATFAVVAVTGVMVFFHLGSAYVMGLHEWFGLAFVLAAGVHVARHFRPFSKLLARTRTRLLFALTGAVAAVFVLTAALDPAGGNPMKQFVGVASEAPLSAVAPLVGTTPAELKARFAASGLTAVTADQTLAEIARAGGRDLKDVVRIVLTESAG